MGQPGIKQGSLARPAAAAAVRCCGRPLTGNAKTLITTAFLFSTITAAQFVASLPQFANSLALRADCLSMLVDALSYLGNLAAECNPDLNSKKAVELGVSGVSIALLLGFTVIFLYEGVTEVSSSENDGSGDDVDPRFVMAFSLFGLVVDGVSLWSFAFCSDDGTHGHGSAIISHSPDNEWKVVGRLVGELGLNRGGEQIEESAESEGDHATSTTTLPDEAVCEGHVALENPLETIKMAEGVVGAEASGDFAEGHAMSNLNMLSALMHVGSDLLRSTTTLVEAVIIMRHPELDSGQVDGWAALVVCSIIAIGALSALVTWVGELQADLRRILKLELPGGRHESGGSGLGSSVSSNTSTKSNGRISYSGVGQNSDNDEDEGDNSFT